MYLNFNWTDINSDGENHNCYAGQKEINKEDNEDNNKNILKIGNFYNKYKNCDRYERS